MVDLTKLEEVAEEEQLKARGSRVGTLPSSVPTVKYLGKSMCDISVRSFLGI